MSLADACVVRMAELNRSHVILTLDSDFCIYRRFGRDPLTMMSPGL
jgi:predicted nucleic acid-binding protein